MNTEDSKDRFHSKLLSMLGKQFQAGDVHYIYNIFAKQIDTIENMKKKIAQQEEQISLNDFKAIVSQRKLASLDKRSLSVQVVESSSSKIKLNPCSGKMTLKMSHKTTEKTRSCFIELAKIVSQFDSFLPFTYRGNICYDPKSDSYCVSMSMRSESKSVMKHSCGIKFSIRCNND